MPYNFNYGGVINTGELKGVINPVDPQDAATKIYVDEMKNYLNDTDTELVGKILTSSGQILIQLGADSEVQWFIAEGGVAEDKLDSDSVSNVKIQDGAVSIAKLDSSVTIDALPPIAGDLSLNGHKITALADPTSGGEAANMRYVDGEISQLDTDIRTHIQTELDSDKAVLNARIDSEAAVRAAADTALGARIDSEAMVRSEQDIILQQNINTEASTRAQADANLQAQIDSGQPDFNQYADLPLDQATESVFETGNTLSLTHSQFAPTTLDNHLVLLFDTDTLDDTDLTTFYTAGDHLRITDNNNADDSDDPIFWTLSITGLQYRDITLGANTTTFFAIFVNPFALLYNDPDSSTNELTTARLIGGVGEPDSEWHLEIAHSGTLQVNTLDSDTAGIVRHANPGEGNSDFYLGGDGFWYRRDQHDTEDFMLTDVNLVSIRDTKWATIDYVDTNHRLNGVIGDSETGVVATDPGLSTPTVQISLDTDVIATVAYVDSRPSGYEGRIGYGLDTDDNNLNVDTDVIASRAYVDNMPSGYQGSIGYGLDTDGGILKVDTDVIADTEWVKEFFVQSSNVSFTSGLLPTKSIQWLDGNGGVNDSVFLTDGYGVEWTSSGGNNLGLDVDTDVIANRQYVADYIHTHQTDTETLGYVKINSFGDAAHAPGDDAIAIGENAVANAQRNIAIGKDAGGYGNTSIAIGYQAMAGDTDKSADAAVAIGASANADTDDAVAVGAGARAITRSSIAIGRHAFAEGMDTIHIGSQSTVGGGTDTDNVILIGHGTISSVANTIALGNNFNWEHASRMGIADYINSVNVTSTNYNDTDTAGAGALARGSFVNTKIQETQDMIHDGGLVAGTGLEYTGVGQFGANSSTDHTLNVDTDVIATQTYVNTHAGVITDTDISGGYGITVRQVTEGGQEHTEINVDTDVIANRAYVDAHEGGNANLLAGTGLRKVTDTEIAIDTEATSNGFPLEGKGTDTLFLDSLFGYRIKAFDTVNNRILFEVFDLDNEQQRSVTWTPSITPRWDQPLTQVSIAFTNQANLNDPFLDKIVSWSVGGNALTLPANKSAYAATQTFTSALTDANSRDDSVVSTWSSDGQGGSKELRYQYGGSNGDTSNEYTSTVNWGDLTASLASTSLTASQRWDTIRQSFTARLGYNSAIDTDNIRAITISTTIDDTTDSESYDKDTDTDANPFGSFDTNNATYTFTGTTIYYDSTVSLSGTGKFRRPTTVMNGTEAQRTREINVTGSTNRTTVYPTWLTQVSDVEQAFDTDTALGSLGVNGYATSANRTDTSTTGWRGRTYTSTQAGADGGTLFLIVPSQARTGFRNPDNLSLTITPVINGDSITLGHSGHTVTYYVYSFNIQPNETLAVQEYQSS